jgi:serine protease AprX
VLTGPLFFIEDRELIMNIQFFKLTRSRCVSWVMTIILTASLLIAPGSAPAAGKQSFIVQGPNLRLVSQLVQRYGGTVTSHLDIIHGVGALLSKTAVTALRTRSEITTITPNRPVTLLGEETEIEEGGQGARSPATDYPDVVGADLVWHQGINGQGVTVAIVDTGLARHRGLMRNTHHRKGRVLAWIDFVEGRRHPHDPNGHGTHVAGIIANSQIGADGEWNGVAPGVNLVAVRVLDETGMGTYEQVIQGIQWVIAHKAEYNIQVMNLSLVSSVQSPYWADPLNQAVMQAWANGITVVVAAGNSGAGAMSIGVPGNNPYVITVGAFTDNYTPANWNDDYIVPFSSAGPTLDGFVKPDLVAPGAHTISTMLPKSYLARNHQANQIANQYFSMAGTSQSAAVVSGVAALTLSKNPHLTPDEVKYRLTATALPWIDLNTTEALYSMWQQGAGRVNSPDAVFGNAQGKANWDLDIQADLAGTQHFEGYSYFDETSGEFRLKGELNTWDGGYGSWAGGYGSWAGGYGSWAGGYGSWAGGYGSWAGGYGSWAGGYGSWAGAYGKSEFASQFANWTSDSGYGSWAGSLQWVGSWFNY